jgi:hypothetical protein
MSSITGKQRASRIPLDYYKHPDKLVRWKHWLTWGAAILTVLWIASVFLAGEKSILGQRRFSHGTVAVAHKPIEHDCAACHPGFGLLASKESVDKNCQACHLAAPMDIHHKDQKPEMTPNCGRCHSDHHGLDFALTRTADRDCVVCHKDLAASTTKSPLDYAAKVTSFTGDHPEFKLLREQGKDPGHLKFNHKYHMTEGIVLAQGGKPFTVGDIVSGEHRARFANGRKNTEAVKLECANCHETEPKNERQEPPKPNPALADSDRKAWEADVREYYQKKEAARGRIPKSESEEQELLPPRKTGKYMKPIKYDNHCAGCHPLNFDPKIDRPVEHGLPLEGKGSLKNRLEEIYQAEYEKSPNLLLTRSPSLLPLPGKRQDIEKPDRDDLISEKVEQAMRALLAGKRACGECHTDRDGNDLTVATTAIAKPDLPEIWFKHARFDHAAHTNDPRNIDCVVCHKDAYPSTEKDLLDAYASPRKGAEQVMIEGIENCKQCHSSSPKPEFADRGLQGKQDCTECHSYHHGDPKAAAARGHGGGFHARRTRGLEELFGQRFAR